MGRLGEIIPRFECFELRYLLSSASPSIELLETAEPLDLSPAASVSVAGDITDDGRFQMYEFDSPARGKVSIKAHGLSGDLDPNLQVYVIRNGRLRRIRKNDNASRRTLDSRVRIRTREDKTYYIRTGAKPGTTGSYIVTLTSDPVDDYGNAALRAGQSNSGYAQDMTVNSHWEKMQDLRKKLKRAIKEQAK